MGLRFYKSFKILPGVRMNVSKSGISWTLGSKAVKLNTGKRGTYLNLSIPKTGISWREKLDKKNDKTKTSAAKVDRQKQKEENNDILQQYEKENDFITNLHKYADDVVTREDFISHLNSVKGDSLKNSLQLVIDGDTDTLNSLIENYINSLQLPYEFSIDYQIEGNVLFVDLDLPEIESFNSQYPALSSNGEILIKNKNQPTIRKQYSHTVISLAIYLTANFFNLSPFIEFIVLSGYSQRRNKDGDLIDEYLFSIRFDRQKMENVDLSRILKPYDFILNFENRINLSTSFNFKAITPYQLINDKKVDDVNPYLGEAVQGLKNLGYTTAEINLVIEKLKMQNLDSAEKYLIAALKELNKIK
ncbi:MAG: DUF4236 domain-containing protein [Erysipelotrichaceae bacterium]|jgi:hypothetical protein